MSKQPVDSNTKRLTCLGANAFNPIFSPDRKKIAFSARGKDSSCHVYIMDIDGSNLQCLTSGSGPNFVSCFNPQSDKIAYISDPTEEDDNYFDVYTMNTDGTEQERLTHSGGTEPVFTSNSRTVIFSNIDITSDIMGVDLQTKEIFNLTDNICKIDGISYSCPKVSPDGKWVYFLSSWMSISGKHHSAICRMRSDGSDYQQISQDDAGISNFIIAPNGEAIVYDTWIMDEAAGKYISELYIMNEDGTGLKQLTDNHSRNRPFSFSPSGEWIAFQSDADGKYDKIIRNWDIYLICADGSELIRLTDNDSLDSNPIFSPDGRAIVFESDRADSKEIYLMPI